MRNFEKFAVHSMLICALLVFFGPLLSAGWLPPMSANLTAEEAAAAFDENRWGIRIGMVLLGASGMFYTLFGSAISTQMERIGPQTVALSRVQFSMAAATGIVISLLGFLGLALAFREEIDPQVLRVGLDLWWLTFAGWYVPALWQYVTIAWAVFSDTAEKVYPRWVAYLNIWVSLSLAPGLYMGFFKTGPFAWHGILGFWLVAVGFFGWAIAMWYLTLRAINHDDRSTSSWTLDNLTE